MQRNEQRGKQRGEQEDRQGGEQGSAQGGEQGGVQVGEQGGLRVGVLVDEQEGTKKLVWEQRRMRKVVKNWCGNKKVVVDLGQKRGCEGQKVGGWVQEGS